MAVMKYRSAKQLRDKVNEFFKKVQEDEIKDPVTMSGLIIYLGISKGTFYNYAKDKKYADTIDYAKLLVENAYEIRLAKGGKAGDIFGLKNIAGWKDKQELDLTASGQIVIEGYDKSWTK